MEGTKPRTASSIGMFDMLKGAGMLTIVFAHTAELYSIPTSGGLSLTAFFPFIYREALMAAFFIASGYGFRKRSIGKCIHQQLKCLLKPFCYTAFFTTLLHFIIHYKLFQHLPSSINESIKVAGGFLLGLPHTATYFGQEFFSCGPMWYLLALLAWLLRRMDSAFFWAVFSGLYGLCFGGLCAAVYLFAKTPAFALSWWLSGLSYDVMHGVGNFVLMLLLYRPLRRALQAARKQLRI